MLKEAKILVVEDESVVAWHVQEALQKLGHKVVAIAKTARDAIQIAIDTRPDLVLMDICLQGQNDGVSAAEHLYLHLDLPVVFLTAHADEQTLHRATQTSPFGYLVKPFQEAELHSTIQIALRRHQLEQALKATQQWYATTLVSIGDATIATDVDGFITFMNPAAEFFTGWTQEQALGEFAAQILNLVDEDTGAAIENPILAALCQGDTVMLPERAVLKSRDGSQRPVGDSASPIRNRSGEIVGGVMVFQDRSDRRQFEHRLNERNQVLEDTQAQLVTELHEKTMQLQRVLACTRLMQKTLTLCRTAAPDVLQQTLKELAQTLRAEYCWVALHRSASTLASPASEGVAIVACEHSTSKTKSRSALGSEIQIEHFSRFYLRLFKHECWICPPLEILPIAYQRLIETPSQLIICPIQDGSQIVGELGVVLSGAATWSESEAELLAQAAAQAAIAQRHAQVYDRAIAQVEQLQTLQTAQDGLINALSHELRVPLTNLRMAVEMVQQTAQMLQIESIVEETPKSTILLWQKLERYLEILQTEWHEEVVLLNEFFNAQNGAPSSYGIPLSEVRLQDWLPSMLDQLNAQAFKQFAQNATATRSQRFSYDLRRDLPSISVALPSLERILLQVLAHLDRVAPVAEILITAAAERDRLHLSLRTGAVDAVEKSSLRLALARKLAIDLKAEIQIAQTLTETTITLILPYSPKPTDKLGDNF